MTKRKKVLPIVVIVLAVLAVAIGAGYRFLMTSDTAFSKQFASADGKYEITVPFNWNQLEVSTQNAVIAAKSADSTMYAQFDVKVATGEEGNSIEEYIYSYIDKIANNSEDPIVQSISIPPTAGELGGKTGYYFELDSISQSVPIHIWGFIWYDAGTYKHICVTSEGESIAKNAELAKSIIISARDVAKSTPAS